MATDKTEPQVGLIINVGIVTIVAIGIVRAVLGVYYNEETQGEIHRKYGEIRPEALMSVRADEKQRLNSGAMPIEKAMAEEAKTGRKAMMPDLMPTASKDLAPLQGWVKMPLAVPEAMTAAPEPPPVAVTLDGGVEGGTRLRIADGGASEPNGRKARP